MRGKAGTRGVTSEKHKKMSKRCQYILVVKNKGTMSLVAGKHVIRSKHQEKYVTDQLLVKRKLSGYTGYRGRIHVTSRKRGKHDDSAREKISWKERLCSVYIKNYSCDRDQFISFYCVNGRLTHSHV